MRRISYLLLLLILLLNAMPKCVGCSKDFAPRGFKTHIKSCRPYKSKKIADVLPKFPDNPVAPLEGLGVYSEEQGSSGLSNNFLFDEVQVNKILVIAQDVFYHVKKIRNQCECQHLHRNIEIPDCHNGKDSYPSAFGTYYHPHHPLPSTLHLNWIPITWSWS